MYEEIFMFVYPVRMSYTEYSELLVNELADSIMKSKLTLMLF